MELAADSLTVIAGPDFETLEAREVTFCSPAGTEAPNNHHRTGEELNIAALITSRASDGGVYLASLIRENLTSRWCTFADLRDHLWRLESPELEAGDVLNV